MDNPYTEHFADIDGDLDRIAAHETATVSPRYATCKTCGRLLPPRLDGKPDLQTMCGACAGKALDALCAGRTMPMTN